MKQNNILVIVAFIILFLLAALSLNKISGNVVTDISEITISINPQVLSFNRFDASHIINVVVKTGDFPLQADYYLTSSDGETVSIGQLCDEQACIGSFSDNFLIESTIDSGSYHFIFYADCTRVECENINKEVTSSPLEIRHE